MALIVSKPAITLNWTPPHVDRPAILRYDIFRVIGTAVTIANLSTLPLVSVLPTANPIQTYADTTVKNNTTYTYFVRAAFDGPQIGKPGQVNSGISELPDHPEEVRPPGPKGSTRRPAAYGAGRSCVQGRANQSSDEGLAAEVPMRLRIGQQRSARGG